MMSRRSKAPHPRFRPTSRPFTGTVIRVAPDVTRSDKTGTPYYLARIRMQTEGLRDEMRFVPGMPVDVFIRTQDRTLLSYLIKPLMDQAARAFREK